nr:MAG TPA: hypothetical protein [Caudoviricetes sp.]
MGVSLVTYNIDGKMLRKKGFFLKKHPLTP